MCVLFIISKFNGHLGLELKCVLIDFHEQPLSFCLIQEKGEWGCFIVDSTADGAAAAAATIGGAARQLHAEQSGGSPKCRIDHS